MASNSSSIGKTLGNIASKLSKSAANAVKKSSQQTSAQIALSQLKKGKIQKNPSNNKSSSSTGGSSKKKSSSSTGSSSNKKSSSSTGSSSKKKSSSSTGSSNNNNFPKENLSAKELTAWKNSVDEIITKKLIPSLKKGYDDAVQLHKVTSSGQDANNLSYRFNDLSSALSQSSKQLTAFIKNFDTVLTEYINVVSKSEKDTSDKMKKSIDQFREAADKIAKLKM